MLRHALRRSRNSYVKGKQFVKLSSSSGSSSTHWQIRVVSFATVWSLLALALKQRVLSGGVLTLVERWVIWLRRWTGLTSMIRRTKTSTGIWRRTITRRTRLVVNCTSSSCMLCLAALSAYSDASATCWLSSSSGETRSRRPLRCFSRCEAILLRYTNELFTSASDVSHCHSECRKN